MNNKPPIAIATAGTLRPGDVFVFPHRKPGQPTTGTQVTILEDLTPEGQSDQKAAFSIFLCDAWPVPVGLRSKELVRVISATRTFNTACWNCSTTDSSHQVDLVQHALMTVPGRAPGAIRIDAATDPRRSGYCQSCLDSEPTFVTSGTYYHRVKEATA